MERNLDDKVRVDAVDQLIETRTEPPRIARSSLRHTYVHSMLSAANRIGTAGGSAGGACSRSPLVK